MSNDSNSIPNSTYNNTNISIGMPSNIINNSHIIPIGISSSKARQFNWRIKSGSITIIPIDISSNKERQFNWRFNCGDI